jgi:RNA polymerase sigma-70 factor, ECF subfamily
MSYLREVELGSSFPPFTAFREYFGYVPGVFRAQSLLPQLLDAEAAIVTSVLATEKALSRIQKEQIILAVAAAARNTYCATMQYQTLSLLGIREQQIQQIISDHRNADLSAADTALLDVAIKLGGYGLPISRKDVDGSFAHACTDEALLETVLITAWTKFLCTVSTGLGSAPDFEPVDIPSSGPFLVMGAANGDEVAQSSGPYLPAAHSGLDGFPGFSFFHEQFGFVPNIFRAQASRPDLVIAETEAIRTIVFAEPALTRLQKQHTLLIVFAANRNSYWVGVLYNLLGSAGISIDELDQIAVDHNRAHLAKPEKALLDFALKLALEPSDFGPSDVELLRKQGFTEEQIVEAVVTTSFAAFLHILQLGLGAKPDFPLRHTVLRPVRSKTVHFLAPESRPTTQDIAADPDAVSVARVQAGDLDAFEDLINRHSRRVYRTLVGVLGHPEEARDAMQDTFLKAFQHLGDFQRRSKFSTWLVSIATNTALQIRRERNPQQSLEKDAFESEEGFRPREIRAWADDPEQLYSKAEMRALVEGSVMKLPPKYRVVLMLRDIEQLPMEDAAAALGLSMPGFKARLLRGRLMLREALSSHFSRTAK